MPDDRDMYERHQVLTAIVGVLIHELRNPLHSATLLVEAMGMKAADVGALRVKLRAQFTKLDAIMSEAVHPIKELALEPRISAHPLGELLATAVERASDESGPGARVAVSCPPGLRVSTDGALLARAISELCAEGLGRAGSPPVRVEATVMDDGVRVTVETSGAPLPDDARKAPFAIAGGGVHLAIARALVNLADASLRFEATDPASSRFVVLLKKA